MNISKSLLLAAGVFPLALSAQGTDSTSTSPAPTATPAPASQATGTAAQGNMVQLPPIDFSGTVFGNYMYDAGKNGQGRSQFNLERNYLNIKGQLGDRTSFRVTTDFYANGASGYDLRMKYAYLQYNYIQNADWTASARVGIVQTVFIDHEENFWPRWVAKTVTDYNSVFSSADVGAATSIKLPNQWGEIYGVVSNGPGYTQTTDPDRFKDYQARLSITPLMSSGSILKTLDLTGWYYKGSRADSIGTVVATGKALDHSRWGLFAGLKDPRVTLGFDYVRAMNEADTGTVVAPLTATTDASLWSAYAVLHPLPTSDGSKSPFGILFRYDEVKPNTDVSADYSLLIAGLTWDLSKLASFSVDVQDQEGHNGVSVTSATGKTVNMHWVFNF